MQSSNLSKDILCTYLKVLLFFLLQFLLASISSTKIEVATVPVKSNFVVPKDIVVKTINMHLRSTSIDYFPSLSTKIATVAASPCKPLIYENSFIFFSRDNKTAAELVKEAIENATVPDDAMTKLVQAEDFTDKCKKLVLLSEKATISDIKRFLRKFTFESGSF